MGNEVQVLVSLDRQHVRQLSEVAERCERAGMKVDGKMEELGVLTGRIDAAKLVDLEMVEGVEAVELSREIRIAPPDSDIQ